MEEKEQEQPIPKELREVMNSIADTLQYAIYSHFSLSKEEYGFTLFLFNLGVDSNSRISYISNANREDMIATLKEFIAKAEGRHFDFTKKSQ